MPKEDRKLSGVRKMQNKVIKNNLSTWLAKYGTFTAVILITVSFILFIPNFASISNFKSLMYQISMLAIVATGLTVVFSVGETDLSTGANVSLAGVLVAYLMVKGVSPVLAIGLTLLMGILIGLLNGVMIGYLRVPALLGTFVTSIIALGINYLLGNGSSIRITEEISGKFFLSLGGGYLLGIPIPFIIAIIVITVLLLLLEKTKWGLRMYAVGGNPEAAVTFGINSRALKLSALVISGVASSVAGLILAARLGAGSPIGGDAYTLDAIAAGYVGVSMFREGQPNILGTIIGVLIMGILVNGMRLLGLRYELQIILRGLFILAAVATAGKRALFKTKLF